MGLQFCGKLRSPDFGSIGNNVSLHVGSITPWRSILLKKPSKRVKNVSEDDLIISVTIPNSSEPFRSFIDFNARRSSTIVNEGISVEQMFDNDSKYVEADQTCTANRT